MIQAECEENVGGTLCLAVNTFLLVSYGEGMAASIYTLSN